MTATIKDLSLGLLITPTALRSLLCSVYLPVGYLTVDPPFCLLPIVFPQTMSLEEGMFFSVGASDRTVRCWDERDRQETYQFLVPGKVNTSTILSPLISQSILKGSGDASVALRVSKSRTARWCPVRLYITGLYH